MPEEQNNLIDGFTKVYDLYSDKIFRHLYFRTGDREKALDMMQETFAKTFVYLKDRPMVENIQAFLYRVATNLMIDEATRNKKKRIESLEALSEQGFDPPSHETGQIKTNIDVGLILSQLNKLPPKYEEIIIMRYVDELSPGEIADALKMSENSVNVRLHRGLNKLRNILKKDE